MKMTKENNLFMHKNNQTTNDNFLLSILENLKNANKKKLLLRYGSSNFSGKVSLLVYLLTFV